MLNYSIIHKWKTSTPTYKLPGPKCNPQIIQPRWPLCNFLTAATKYILSHAQIQRLNFIQNCCIFKKTSKSPLEESTNLHRFKSADTGFERRSRDRDVHTCSDAEVWLFHEFLRTSTRPTTRSRRRVLHRHKHDSSPAAVIGVSTLRGGSRDGGDGAKDPSGAAAFH